ncbi:ATP-binding cassette domain-containing protein [Candidatus Bathyarchaeota archaeon]|nr:ATP-binding cassette domain-containing protein [Candidatus Bathyarchaeota archaeon]
MNDTRPIIETLGLTKRFGELQAVDHIDLLIREGEVFGLLGPNGAGKTTTLSMLATLLKPTEGTAKVDGHDVLTEPAAVRKSIGIVFQEPSSDDILTGRENLYLHALMYGVDRRIREQRFREVLKLVDLEDRADDQVKKYSGGMRRRLELARGLLHKPKILFLDEPTLGLDPQAREHIWQYIRRLVDLEHVTVILTTHYMEEAERLCDRVAIIDDGRIIALDTPERLKHIIGGDIIRLRIQNPQLGRIKELGYVVKIDQAGDLVTLTVKDSGVHLQEILSLVGDVKSVELRTPTLNDVFLHFTGHEIRGDNAEGGFFQRVARARSGGN